MVEVQLKDQILLSCVVRVLLQKMKPTSVSPNSNHIGAPLAAQRFIPEMIRLQNFI